VSPEEAEEVHRRCTPQNIQEHHRLVEAAYADRSINDAERALLEKKATELKIDSKTAKAIEDNYVTTVTSEKA